MKLGSSDIVLALGNDAIDKAYLGTELVYSSAPPPPPYDWEVEYIQTNGTQYIDTGIVPTLAKETEIVIVLASVSGNTGSQGFGSNSNLNMALPSNNKWRFNGVQTNIPIIDDTYCTITLKQTSQGRYYDVDGISGYGSSNAGNYHFQIARLGGSSYTFWAKWKSVVIKENDNVVLNLIPVRVGQVGYMYDEVSGQLFGNAGTGDFILGSDV